MKNRNSGRRQYCVIQQCSSKANNYWEYVAWWLF